MNINHGYYYLRILSLGTFCVFVCVCGGGGGSSIYGVCVGGGFLNLWCVCVWDPRSMVGGGFSTLIEAFTWFKCITINNIATRII